MKSLNNIQITSLKTNFSNMYRIMLLMFQFLLISK